MEISVPAKKTVDTLVDDIYDIVREGKTASKENLKLLGKGVSEAVAVALKQGCHAKETILRMSNLGTPDRKLWYTLRGYPQHPLAPAQAISFMYGHMIEQLLLFLAREAGHIVTDEQKTVELDGVVGHLDCKIDGILIDAKGMSNYGFQKFLSAGTLLQNDTFGYGEQISGYAQAENEDTAGFFAFNKERGSLILCMLGEFDLINARGRISQVREMVAKDTPPKRCYKPIPMSKTSPNLILDKPCSWCPFHDICWAEANGGKGLRKFKYADGIKYFVHIESEPRVEEIIINEKEEELQIQE